MANNRYGSTVLRLILGLLFILPGLDKLMGMLGEGHMVQMMLWNQAWLAWVLLLVEILFGLAILLGWKLEWTTWPPIVIMLGAIFTAVLPMRAENPMWVIQTLFHLLAIAGLLNLFWNGPGAYAVKS